MWNYTCEKGYPDITLHDCTVCKAQLKKGDLTLEFDDNGFWIGKNHSQNPFGQVLRTGKAQIKFTNIDPDFSSVHIHKKPFFGGKKSTVRKEVPLCDFIKKLNGGKWTFEVVDEYQKYRSVMYCGCVKKAKKPYFTDMQIEIFYENRQYFWDKIYEDRPW